MDVGANVPLNVAGSLPGNPQRVPYIDRKLNKNIKRCRLGALQRASGL